MAFCEAAADLERIVPHLFSKHSRENTASHCTPLPAVSETDLKRCVLHCIYNRLGRLKSKRMRVVKCLLFTVAQHAHTCRARSIGEQQTATMCSLLESLANHDATHCAWSLPTSVSSGSLARGALPRTLLYDWQPRHNELRSSSHVHPNATHNRRTCPCLTKCTRNLLLRPDMCSSPCTSSLDFDMAAAGLCSDATYVC